MPERDLICRLSGVSVVPKDMQDITTGDQNKKEARGISDDRSAACPKMGTSCMQKCSAKSRSHE